MRIERLDLTRYGRFSDYAIDFGPRPESGPDFHVIYGLNEAGKSTAAAAILDLLYGIEERSAYGAGKGGSSAPGWHPYAAMRIGARLDLTGGSVEVARLKRDKASLIDKDNLAFDDAALKAELAGVGREAFRMMFSLDDESLEKGGEEILRSGGDLGRLLFSASAGLAEMSARLDALRERAELFHKRYGRSTELAQKKQTLESLKSERERLDTLASAYADLVRRRTEAKGAHAAAAKTLSERRARAVSIGRLIAGLPHLGALAEAERQFAPLESLPVPPAGWADEVARLEAEAIRLAAQSETAEAAIKGLIEEAEHTGDDPAALALGPRVEAWREKRSRYDAAKDIPARESELAAKRAVAADILRRLGREGEADPQSLILSARAVGAFEDLIASRSGVESKLAAAREALEAARSALAEAVEAAPSAEDDPGAVDFLKARLATARRDNAHARLADARDGAGLAERKLADALSGLKPWAGGAEALKAVPVPGPAETALLRDRLAEARARRQAAADALAQKTAEAARLSAEAEAAARAADVVDDDAASALRAAREAAWQGHRAALSVGTADAFEASMRRDDAAGAARLVHARELAARRERAVALAGVEADRRRAEADCAAAQEGVGGVAHEIAALLPAPAPAGRDPLAFLEGWRVKRDEALARAEALAAAEDALRRLGEDAERARRALKEGLAAARIAHDADGSMQRLIEIGEAAITAAALAETRRARVKERRTEVGRAERKLKVAQEDEARWREAWRGACADCWLGRSEPPTVGAMRQTLKALDDLRAELKDSATLVHRIEAMAHDRKTFAEEAVTAAAALGLAPDEDAARLADAVEARVAAAREARRRREEKEKALQAAREKRAAIAEAEAVNRRLAAAMTGLFGVATLAEVAAKLDDCKRRDALREEIGRETRAVLAAGVASSFEAARATLEAVDRAALEEELSDLSARAPADQQTFAETYAAGEDAAKALIAVGGDDAVARIEEQRRTILEEIKEGARRYLALRAGVAAAEQALRLYRDRHRGAMMERASKAFAEISRGAYRGLAAEPNGASETLIALSPEGGSKSAEQLSKGARFQLYLALRVAGYHELAKIRRPAPFVADDIMETFDHFRAEEALKLFAEMATVGQVIYLTHHQHLAEIARKVCPAAQVHALAP